MKNFTRSSSVTRICSDSLCRFAVTRTVVPISAVSGKYPSLDDTCRTGGKFDGVGVTPCCCGCDVTTATKAPKHTSSKMRLPLNNCRILLNFAAVALKQSLLTHPYGQSNHRNNNSWITFDIMGSGSHVCPIIARYRATSHEPSHLTVE